MPGPHALEALRLNINTLLNWFFMYLRLFTTRQNCRAFRLLHLIYRLRKLTTLAFIIFERLKRIELNSTRLYDPRIRSKSVKKSGIHIQKVWNLYSNRRPQNVFQGGDVEIFLIRFRLLTM